MFCFFVCFFVLLLNTASSGKPWLEAGGKKWLCFHLEHVKDKIQIAIAFQCIYSIQNRMARPASPLVAFE